MLTRLAGAVAAVALFAACGGGDGAVDQQPTPAADAGPAPSWLTALNPQYATDWTETPPSQRAPLLDGDLTFAEYEQAVLAEVQCIRAAGFAVNQEPSYSDLEHRFSWSFSSGDDLQLAQQTSQHCNREHSGFLGAVWASLHQPTEAERSDAIAFLSDCLGTAGYADFPEPGAPGYYDWYNDLREHEGRAAAEGVSRCMGETTQTFGFVP